MKSNIDEELHGRSLGWICPKCGRVHAPFIMECFYCNDKLKSEEEIIHYPFVTSTDEYFQELEKYPTNLDLSIYKYSSQEQLQESLDGLNKELENLGAQPTNLDELNNIKTAMEDIHQSEEIAQDETYMMEHWICSRCGKVHLVFPEGGCECGAPLEYLTYVI